MVPIDTIWLVLVKTVAFACHFVATHPPPTLPPCRSATDIGYTSKQVDILISKNQALQILYLKHTTLHKLPWIETHENLICTKLNIYTV